MARKLTASEFYKLVGDRTGMDIERTKFVWQEIIDVIANEVLMYGTVTLPYFGTIKSRITGGKTMPVPVGSEPENRGKVRHIYVEPHEVYYFSINEGFSEVLKGKNVTMSQKRRQREAFRQLKIQEQIREDQFAYMEKAQAAAEIMNKRFAERKAREKKLNKMSKKKREALLKQENSYWDELEELEDSLEDEE